MTKEKAIQIAHDIVSTDDVFTDVIGSVGDIRGMEAAAVFGSLLSNDTRGEGYSFKTLIEDEMRNNPIEYISSYDGLYEQFPSASYFRVITRSNIHVMILRSQSIWSVGSSLEYAFKAKLNSRRNKYMYAHEVLSSLFGKGTGFPSVRTNGTFYRFNLLMYWLTYKFKIWDFDSLQCSTLLPCSDAIFNRAYQLGIVKSPLKSSLRNAEDLTKKARMWFGEKEYYKMYELLKFYDGKE